MPFKKGQKKVGGRKKGTPNKDTKSARDIAERLGCEPFEILCKFAMNDWRGLGYDSEKETRYTPQGDSYYIDRIEPKVRVKAAKEAAEYLYPKRKAIELTGDDGKSLPVVKILLPDNNRDK